MKAPLEVGRPGRFARSLFGTLAVASAGALVAACEGPPGADGTNGIDGADGMNGIDGADGANGIPGADGTNGIDGVDGTIGIDGQDGVDGTNGTNGANGTNAMPRLIDASYVLWEPANVSALNDLLLDYGRTSPTWSGSDRPVAVFDWDNTVMKNDIGDATLFFILNNDLILQPADWAATAPDGAGGTHLTSDAVVALNSYCAPLAAVGDPLPTSTDAGCRNTIFDVYYNNTVAGSTMGGFAVPETLTIQRQYAWLAQLLAGYRPAEVRDIAAEAYDEAFSAAIGDTLAFSGTSVPAWVRIYDEMADLIGALQDDGFDVWIVSASPQNVVEAVAELVGVAHNHVIGIRTTTAGGRLTATLQSCNGDSDLITFNLGKRCWINKVIFSDEVSGTTTNDTAHLPTFVAGDSDTDIAMIKDASVLKLAINRNKIQLMCNAFSNYLGRWIVQPMFISPKACRTTLYACSTALDTAGNFIVDEAGMTMADQADAVCLLP